MIAANMHVIWCVSNQAVELEHEEQRNDKLGAWISGDSGHLLQACIQNKIAIKSIQIETHRNVFTVRIEWAN